MSVLSKTILWTAQSSGKMGRKQIVNEIDIMTNWLLTDGLGFPVRSGNTKYDYSLYNPSTTAT